MGLDAVEIILEVEETFAITLPDDRVEKVRTVGDLYDLVLELKPTNCTLREYCLSASTFRLLRRTLRDELHLGAARIRPSDAIDDFFPDRQRRRLWGQLQDSLGLRFPRLVRPSWLVVLLAASVILASSYAGYEYVDSLEGVLALLVITVGVSPLLCLLSRPFATRFDRSLRTFRDLTLATVTRNYATLADRFEMWNQADIWQVLQTIIVEQMGLKPEAVAPKARFVEDLGVS